LYLSSTHRNATSPKYLQCKRDGELRRACASVVRGPNAVPGSSVVRRPRAVTGTHWRIWMIGVVPRIWTSGVPIRLADFNRDATCTCLQLVEVWRVEDTVRTQTSTGDRVHESRCSRSRRGAATRRPGLGSLPSACTAGLPTWTKSPPAARTTGQPAGQPAGHLASRSGRAALLRPLPAPLARAFPNQPADRLQPNPNLLASTSTRRAEAG
jgi:hypothetical protein